MALNLEAKKAVVEQVNAVAINAVSVGVAEYRGLNVEQMTNLRNSAIDADVSLKDGKAIAKKLYEDRLNALDNYLSNL